MSEVVRPQIGDKSQKEGKDYHPKKVIMSGSRQRPSIPTLGTHLSGARVPHHNAFPSDRLPSPMM